MSDSPTDRGRASQRSAREREEDPLTVGETTESAEEQAPGAGSTPGRRHRPRPTSPTLRRWPTRRPASVEPSRASSRASATWSGSPSPCCSPRATCSSRTCPASARRCSPRRWPARSTARCAASSSPRTCCPVDITGVSIYNQETPRVRVQARRDLRQHRRRRRDQPRLAEDPVRAARVHGGAPGHRRRRRPTSSASPFMVHRDPEPDRDGGHLPAPRGAARPVHGPDLDGLPRRRRPSWRCSTPTASTLAARRPRARVATPPRSPS